MPCTWTLCIQYCDCWYHFEKLPGRAMSITCEILLQVNEAGVLRLFGLQPIKLHWVINICLLYVNTRYTFWILFSAIFLVSTANMSFWYVSFALYLPHKFRINYFLISCNNFVLLHTSTSMTIWNLRSPSTEQTFKYGAISGVSWLLWGRSWIWFKSSGFSDYYAIHYCNQPVL